MKQEIVKQIRDAMGREKSAYSLYLGMCRHAKNENQVKFFQTLALQEAKHESVLAEYMKTGSIALAKEKLAQRYFNEDLDIYNKISPTVDLSGLYDGFELAIREEQKAQKIYLELMDAADSEDLKDLFHTLLSQEVEHERLLLRERSELAGS